MPSKGGPGRPVDVQELTDFVAERLREASVPEDAGKMQAYMKTDMPFYGVKKPARVPIQRDVKKAFVPSSRSNYEKAVRALWALPHREEKYLALSYARAFKGFVTFASMPLYERLIRQGQWWDLVDEVVMAIVSPLYKSERAALLPTIEGWIDDDDMWIRRAAIISQLKHKADTDHRQLFDFCRRRMHEKEFFIRKAIGWALREYTKSEPERVKAFLLKEKDNLSGLSYREAARPLIKAGLL